MKKSIGENIRELRKKNNMSQDELAEVLGVTAPSVHKWETDKMLPSIDMLLEMAAVFKVSTDSILGFEVSESEKKAKVDEILELVVDRKFKEAITLAEEVIKKYPNDYDVLYNSAVAYCLYVEKFKKTARKEKYIMREEELYRRALLVVPEAGRQDKETDLWYNIARCKDDLGDWKEAIRIIEEHNHRGIYNIKLAEIYLEHARDVDKAVKYIESAADHAESDLRRCARAAIMVYKERKMYKEGINMCDFELGFIDSFKTGFDESISYDIIKADVYFKRALLKADLKDYNGAEADLDEVFKLIERYESIERVPYSGLRFNLEKENKSMIIYEFKDNKLDEFEEIAVKDGDERFAELYREKRKQYNLEQ